MIKRIFILSAVTFYFFSVTINAQNISEIVLDPTGKKMSYIKDSDSLFITHFNSNSRDVLVTTGISQNGNQRFLTWTRNGKELVYEKENNLFRYNLEAKKSTPLLKDPDSLIFFKFYLINQIDISSENVLYFSAGLTTSENKEFQLFKLDLEAAEIQQFTNDTLGVSNISVSNDDQYIAYSSYTLAEKWKAKINVIRSSDGKLIAQSDLHDETFFFGLKWSPDDQRILARNARGGERIFNFNSDSGKLQEIKSGTKKGQYLFDFFNKDLMYSVENKGDIKEYSLYNVNNGQRQSILGEANLNFIGKINKRNSSDKAYFTKESRIAPKELLSIKIKPNKVSQKEIVHSFIDNNPLEGYHYSVHNYKNGNEKSSSAYVYFPSGYDRTSQNKYPLLIVSYGGFTDNYPDLSYFLYENLFNYISKNYVIAFVNTRGIATERQQQNYGAIQLQDTELFVADAINNFQIDGEKIFVIGHSHGGAMVYYFLTHSKIFRGGIAINGAADWIAQAELESMVGLPDAMGGPPAELRDLYTSLSPMENISNLEDPLLLFSGGLDTQIPAEINAKAFFSKAQFQNKDVRYHHFPDEGHLIEKSENRAIFWSKVNQFLQELN